MGGGWGRRASQFQECLRNVSGGGWGARRAQPPTGRGTEPRARGSTCSAGAGRGGAARGGRWTWGGSPTQGQVTLHSRGAPGGWGGESRKGGPPGAGEPRAPGQSGGGAAAPLCAAAVGAGRGGSAPRPPSWCPARRVGWRGTKVAARSGALPVEVGLSRPSAPTSSSSLGHEALAVVLEGARVGMAPRAPSPNLVLTPPRVRPVTCGRPWVRTWSGERGSLTEWALAELGQLLGPLLVNWRDLIFFRLFLFVLISSPPCLYLVCIFVGNLRSSLEGGRYE